MSESQVRSKSHRRDYKLPSRSSSLKYSNPRAINPFEGLRRYTRKRILVVDDEEDTRLILRDRLEAMGYSVFTATNGFEALSVLDLIPLDGVLLDIEMPVMDGLKLLEKLPQRHIYVPVIVMSAEENQQKLVKAVEYGAMDYLMKPVDTALLAQKCHSLFY